MRIAIIGAGNVGGTLGRRWAGLGHSVSFGVRRPEEGAAAVHGSPDVEESVPENIRIVAVRDAVRDAEVVLLATPWNAVPDALREIGAADGSLDGVTLLDATNPLKANLGLDVGPNGESGGERVQAMAPDAHVVKVFNTTGYDNMRDPTYGGSPTVMFAAGDDADAKRIALALATVLGFEAIDAGPLTRARELEYLASLWIALAYGAGAPALGRDFAFRIVRRAG